MRTIISQHRSHFLQTLINTQTACKVVAQKLPSITFLTKTALWALFTATVLEQLTPRVCPAGCSAGFNLSQHSWTCHNV
jgi:hypothetical protein